MEHIVTECENCPMFYDGRDSGDYDRLICNHPKAKWQTPTPLEPIPEVEPIEIDSSGDEMSYIEWVVTPEWCPLKEQPISIILKKDNE